VKSLSQEFKVKREDVLDAVTKQKEQIKQLQHGIKELRSKIIAVQMPIWQQKIEVYNDIPFLFLHVTDMTQEDLRSIATQLSQKNAGFYCIVNESENKTIFYSLLSPEYTQKTDLQKLTPLLKEYGLRGGIMKNSIQG